jgi:hypothetical protein
MRQLLFIAVAVLVLCSTAYAQVPREIHFQGFLTDAGTNPLTGTYSIVFRIYDADTGGAPLWEETHATVDVANGYYDVTLGVTTALNLAFDVQYYLAIEVQADGEMTPRFAMAAAPYALRAAVADDAENLNGQAGSYYSDYNNLANKPASMPPDAHTHPGSDITSAVASADNADLLDGQDGPYYLAWANITGAPAKYPDADLLDGLDGSYYLSWANITGKPATYASDWTTLANKPAKYPDADLLDGLDGAYYLDWNNFTNTPATYAPSAHNHDAAYVNVGGDTMTGTLNCRALIPTATAAYSLGGSTYNWWNIYVADMIRNTQGENYLGFSANGNLQFYLDDDNDTTNYFRIYNGVNNEVVRVDESGNVRAEGNYTYESAKTYYYKIPPCEFALWPGDDDTYDFYAGYGWTSGGAVAYAIGLYAPVRLPEGADIQEITAYYRDSNTTINYNISITVSLRRSAMDNTGYENFCNNVKSTTGTQAPGYDSVFDPPDTVAYPGCDIVNNATYQYTAYIYMNTGSYTGNSTVCFLGCSIRYTMTTVAP